jgi:nucleotide-binding universal stress UspA family protein
LVIDAATVLLDPGSDRVLRGRRDGDRNHEAVVVVESVVVGTDGSETAAAAVRRAVALAQAFGARLSIVSAYEPVSGAELRSRVTPVATDVQWTVQPREDVLSLLEAAAADTRAAGVEHVETFARVGDAADAILDVAEEQRSDLIVVGNKGMTGATRFLLGSVPNKISHHAPCSVLIVRTS